MLALSNKAATIAREAVQKSQEQQPIKKAPKKGGKDWLDEMVTKQEIIDRVGIIDPIIQPKIESTLSSMSYAGKSKMEVTNDLVEDLEKQVEKLKFQRVKMLQEQQKAHQKASDQREEDIVPEDPDEVMFQKAFKAQDTEKLHEIVDKRRSKLEDLERKWREKKELEQMRNAGLLDSDTYTKMAISQQRSGPSKLYNEPSNRVYSPSRVAAVPVTRTSEEKPYRDRPITQALTYQAEAPRQDEDLKDLLKKSEKLRAIDPRRSDFNQKVANYLVGKQLKEETEEYYKSKEKKKFERHTSPASLRKSQDKFDPSSGAPISHLPLIHEDKTSKQLEKENRQNNLPAEKKVNKRKVQEINELFIIKLVFDALNHENKGVISKDEVIDYVLTNQDIVTIFDLKSSFSGEVLTFASEQVGLLNFQEFSQLMMKRLPPKTQKEIKSAFPFEKARPQAASHQEMQHQDMLLNHDEIQIFSEIFTHLDKYEDLLIKTEDYLNALRADLRIQIIIKKPAVKIPVVDRELTVGEILDQIETDMTTALDIGTNTMQYISWNQFLDYFKTYKASKFTRTQPNKEEEAEEMLLSEEKLQVIQDVFDMLPRVAEDYVDKIEFVKASKQDPQVHSFWKEEVDPDNERTVGKIFDQILASEANYLKWEEVLPFFTRGGAPAKTEDEADQGAQESGTQIYKNEFPTFAPDHISEAAQEDESRGDVSPEKSPVTQERATRLPGIDAKTKKTTATSKDTKNKREISREPKNFDNLDAELRKEYELLQEDLKAYGVIKKNLKDERGLTIPKPFKFQEKTNESQSIRQQKVAKMVEEKRKEESDALNYKFKANETPAYVTAPMYGTIVKAQEERRMEVTEKSKQITLANQKPFSFYERDKDKPKAAPKEESVTQFKSKPVPQFVKTEIMKDKEEEDKKKREERIKARMEDNLANAKLPPRMEMHEKAKQDGTTSKRVNPNKYQPEEATFKPKIKKDIPDFEQQQKEFETNLQSKKQERPKTQFKAFEFQKKEESEREASQKEESSVKNVKKQAPKKVVQKAAPAAKSKPPTKKGKQEEEEEQQEQEEQPQDEEQQQEEDYAPDEDHANEEENAEEGASKRGGQSNMGDEEEKGDDGDFFKAESQDLGDEAANPSAATYAKPIQKKEEMTQKSQKSEGSVRGSVKEAAETSVKGEDKKKPILTKKLQQEFDRRKAEKEALAQRAEDKKKEEAQRKQKEKDFAPKVVNAYNTVNRLDKREEENKERIKESRDRMRREQQDYDEKLKEMKAKLDTAPLMIENKMHGSKFLQKYRNAAARGWNTLEGPTGEAAPSEQNEVSQRQESERETKRPSRQETKARQDKEENIQRGSSKRQVVKQEEKEPEQEEQNEAAEPEEQQEQQEADEQNDAEEKNNEEEQQEEQQEEQPEEPQEAANEDNEAKEEENQGDNEENKERDEEKEPSEKYEEEFEDENEEKGNDEEDS